MKFYRIKQISETEFIPQMRNWYEFNYCGIQSIHGDYNTWNTSIFQKLNCIVSSLEYAKVIIEDYKKSSRIKMKYPKYIKIK